MNYSDYEMTGLSFTDIRYDLDIVWTLFLQKVTKNSHKSILVSNGEPALYKGLRQKD